MQQRQLRWASWLLIILMPLLVFPTYWMIASFFDWLMGDASVVLRILHESKGQFLRDFLADWVSSLPVSAIFIWLLYLPIYKLLVLKVKSKPIQSILAGILAGIIVGVWLYSVNLIGLVIVGMTGFLISILFLCWHWIFALRWRLF